MVTDELDATQVVSAEPETPTLVVSSHQSRQTRTVQTSVQPVDPLEVTQVGDNIGNSVDHITSISSSFYENSEILHNS